MSFVVDKDDVASRRGDHPSRLKRTIRLSSRQELVQAIRIVVDGVKLVQDGKKVDYEKR